MTSHPVLTPATTLKRLSWLSDQEVAALEAYCDALVRALGRERVKSVILYGSKARGDAHPDSDLDLLVILDPGDEAQIKVARNIESEVSVDCLLPFSLLEYSTQQAAEMQRVGHPLMQNIAREGIVLVGGGITVNPIETKRFVKEYMDSAREHLRATELLIDGDAYKSAVSEAYYASLDAADAALIAVGTMPRSHEGTRVFFSEKFIKTKLVPERYKDIFEELQVARTSADYKREVRVYRPDAERALERAKDFAVMIEQLLPSLLK